MQQTNFFNKYKSIVVFLILEVLALIAFNFANICEVLFFIAIALTAVAFLFSFYANNDKKDFLKILPVVGVLFVISGIAAFGGFSNSFHPVSNIAVFFALPSFFSLGFFARKLDNSKPENYLFAIGFGLSAIVFVGIIITIIQYGFFYAEIHKVKPIYFYNGVAYNVTKEMGWLMGFKVKEVTLEYGGFFALLCGVFLPGLLFISPKENRNQFICAAVIGGVGLISILLVPNWQALIFLIVVSIFAFVYKFLKTKMLAINILSLIVVSIVGIGVLFYLITIVNAAIGFKIGTPLNRLFTNNFIMKGPTDVLKGVFAKDINGHFFNLFGFNIESSGAPYAGDIGLKTIINTKSYVFEYEILKEVGLIGTIFVLLFFATMFVSVVYYVRDSKDKPFVKNVVVMFLLAFVLFATFRFDIFPTHIQEQYQAFLRSLPLMLALFVFGFSYFPSEAKTLTETSKHVTEASL